MNNQSHFDAAQRHYDNQMPEDEPDEDEEEREPDFDEDDDFDGDCGEAECFAME